MMMIPGMIDAHCHPFLAAFWLSGLKLEIEMTKEQVIEEIRDYVSANPEKETYFGLGYPEWEYDEKGPNKKYLDDICDNKPICILSSSGHEAWCNSKALEIVNITKDTPDPIAGLQYFERDKEGNPTGHIVESAAIKTIMSGIEWFDPEEVRKNFKEIFDDYSKMGITSLVDCGTYDYLEEQAIAYIDDYEKRDALQQRVCSCVMVEDRARLDKVIPLLKERSQKHKSDNYFINTLKILNDGTMETRSASLSEPYNEDGALIETMLSEEELNEICVAAAKEGFDIHIHAIGDKAIHRTLMAAKAVREAGYHDTRITNAHTDYVRTRDNHLFGKYNVIVNTTGSWHCENLGMEKVIGERVNKQFRILSLIKEGARMSLGSDKPVDQLGAEPVKGIQMAVTRKVCDDSAAPILEPESEKLSIHQCLEGYTINAAYEMHMEDKLGSIEPGKYADLTVLEKDIFEIPVYEMYKTKTMLTMKGGKITYRNM